MRHAIVGAAALLAFAGPALAQDAGVRGVDPHYVTGPAPAKDSQTTLMVGPLDKPGFYTTRVKLAKGGLVPPHTHPDARYITVLAGDLYVCTTDVVDKASAKVFHPGAFIVEPAGSVHCSWAPDGEVEYQESGVGPTGTAFAK